jgi:AcrR family transcriptional regulator
MALGRIDLGRGIVVSMPGASPRKPLRRDARDSRERLILAAERLFGERSIDGVSLREINKAAGQKNASGLRYHFGTKMDLVAGVWRHRLPALEARRQAMLAQMRASGGTSDLRQILSAMVMPLIELLDNGRNERSYVRFVAQLYSHPSIREEEFASPGFRETHRLAQRLLAADFPADLVRQRLGQLVGHLVHALADLENRIVKQARPAAPRRTELFVSNLLDTAVGALTAPVSPTTAALLRRH